MATSSSVQKNGLFCKTNNNSQSDFPTGFGRAEAHFAKLPSRWHRACTDMQATSRGCPLGPQSSLVPVLAF